jgi:hypothetical protein
MNISILRNKAPGSIPRSSKFHSYLTLRYYQIRLRLKDKWRSILPESLKTAFEGGCAVLKGTFLIIKIPLRTILYYLRNHPIHAAVNLFICTAIVALVLTGAELHQQLILSKISNDTVSRIISGSDFTRQYDIEGMRKNGVREFVSTGAPKWTQSEGVKAILFEARKAGLSLEDQAVLLAIANIESGFNPAAQAGTTSACGLFQFVEKTGEMYNLSATDCMDPWLNARAGVSHYIDNYDARVRKHVESLQGIEKLFKTFQLSYYLHHDGPNSSNPGNDLKAIVLDGTKFLFRAYHALEEEEESHKHAPGFSGTFYENTLKTFNTIKESINFEFLGRI